MQAGNFMKADGDEEKPVKRGDGGDQPGRGPGLEKSLSSRLVRRLGWGGGRGS